MEIYVLIDDKPQGPYTRELVRQYLSSGQLMPTDLAAYAGRSDWKPLSVMMRSWTTASPQKASPPSPAPSAKRKPVAAIISAAVVVLVVAGAVFWMLNRRSVPPVAGMDERHFPKSLAELNNWYVEPPEGQNAATFYLKGAQAIQVTQADQKSADLPVLGSGKMPELGEPLEPQTKATIAAFVQNNDAAWKSLQEGANFEQARYPIDMNLGSETLLPHLAKIKQAALVAELRAINFADNKQPQEAADAILVSLAVAQSVKDEPILISQLVRDASIAIDTVSLEYTMNSVALLPADLERLSNTLARAESMDSEGVAFTRALVAERVFTLAFLDSPPDKVEAQLKNIQGSDGAPKMAMDQMLKNLKAQRAFIGDTLDYALKIRREPFPQRLKLDEYMTSRANEAKNKQFFLCQMVLPALGKATSREAKGLATLRLAQTSIALERFRQDNGSYPDSLSALVPRFLPAVPVDPFEGNAIQYQKSGEGYELTGPSPNTPKPLSFKVIKPPKSV